MRLFILLFISFQLIAQEVSWINNTSLIRTYSSARSVDLNNDGIEDIVIGGGVDGFPTPYGVIAINGLDGTTLWTVTTRNEMFTSPQFYDFNADGTNDVIIAGRDAELRLINGLNGQVIWEFWGDENTNPNDQGWYNFYTPQIIEDQNNDNIPDLLITNGGDHSLDFSVIDRPPGHIMIISGATGEALKTVMVPDEKETYMSPLICDLNNDGNYTILFGTGGESVAGNLWATSLNDLMNEDISNAIPLINNSELEHIAPPSIGDLNNDNTLDIVVQGFDGKITAINGANFNILWQYVLPNTESSASPILGNFSVSDDNLDVFATIFSGGMNSYDDYYQVLLDGENGNVLWSDSLGLINFCTPVAFDSNANEKDEILISVINNNGSYFENELILIDFVNQSSSTLFGPIPGGNISSTPQIKDIDQDGFIDIIFSVRADSLDPFGDGVFYENGINTLKITTEFTLPNQEVAWGSYMGTFFDGLFNSGCNGDLGLFAFPSQVCPGEENGEINLFVSAGTPPYTYLWSNGETTEDLDSLAPGTYSVTVTDANGFCDVISREINEYGVISFYQTPSCPGNEDGTVYFNSTGCDCNTSFCQFIWELNGDTIAQGDGSTAEETYKYLTGIGAGTYTATIIHPDGCEIQELIEVPESAIVSDFNIINDCLANGSGSIELYTNNILLDYLWNTGETTNSIYNLEEGLYNVIVSDTSIACVDTMYFEIENFFPYNCNNECLNDFDLDLICDELEISGCTNQEADNYNSAATDDDGSCIFSGCTDINACNYNTQANIEDGSCIYPILYYDCNNNCVNDFDLDLICDELDNCPQDYNPYQEDFNSDNTGDICDGISLNEKEINIKLIKTIDLLGRDIVPFSKQNTILYIYNDGNIKKKHFIK